MEKDLIQQNWYNALIDDCKAIITETIFTSRWAKIEGYHNLGQRILEDENKFPKDKRGYQKMSQRVATSLGKSQRTVEQVIQFYKKYPELDKLPEGKNISWHKICNKYLPQPKENKIIEPLPEGKYNVIYADPPWKYDIDLAKTRSPEKHYPVMDLKDLINIAEKIKNISSKNCVLFLWITAPKLNWLNEVLTAWGFEYKTNLIWDKVKHNMGHYASIRHEILTISTKGSFAPLCDGKIIQSIDSVQSIDKSSIHSQKPEKFREIIEILYPDTTRIELFARKTQEEIEKLSKRNWHFWGNEI